MALFKIAKGTEANLAANKPNTTEGYCYVTTDTKKFYVDTTTATGTGSRICLNAANADTVNGLTVETAVPANAKFTDTKALGSMTGTLGVDHGGTGQTSLDNVTVGKAKALDYQQGLITTSVSNSHARFMFTIPNTTTTTNGWYRLGYTSYNNTSRFALEQNGDVTNEDGTVTKNNKYIIDAYPGKEALFHGKADSATKLATSRIITADLSTSSEGSFDGSAAITISVSGVLPASKGGTGTTTLKDAASSLVNALDSATGVPTDTDYFISQHINGNKEGTTSNSYYRRPISTLWSYTKEKMASDTGVNISGRATSVSNTYGWFGYAGSSGSEYGMTSLTNNGARFKVLPTGATNGYWIGVNTAGTNFGIYDETAKKYLLYTPTSTFSAVFNGNATNVTGTVAIAHGGTGATTAAAARTNLGAAPAYVYSTTDLTAGTSTLTTGVLYFVYE